MNPSANSVSFVITAIYTYTFANSVYRVLAFNEASASIQIRTGTTWINGLCLVICVVMALRFFFGNNRYVDGIFAGKDTAPRRLYHLTVIVTQSLILLGASYLIRNPQIFFLWIGVLFVVELGWYVGCYVFIRPAISDEGKLKRPLLHNEIANFVMAAGAAVGWALWPHRPMIAAVVVGIVFAANSWIDIRVNLNDYMAVEPPAVAR